MQLPVYQLAVRQAGGKATPISPASTAWSRAAAASKTCRCRTTRQPPTARLRDLVGGAVDLVDAGMFPRTTRGRCDYCDVGYACGSSDWARARKREHEALAPVVRLQAAAAEGGATMAPERVACDQDVRDRVTSELGTTFLLEAGAGTGKTRVLVDRYVRCVLDPDLGTGDVRSVAAITFTEKAAGELRQRIREEFEKRAAAAAAGSEEATIIQTALDALDDAPIGTIHGFAGRLLREFPVEAASTPPSSSSTDSALR